MTTSKKTKGKVKVAKKKPAKKPARVAKKKATKKTTSVIQKHQVVVKIETDQTAAPSKALTIKESDIMPQKENGKYMLVPSALSEKQVMRMLQKTPPQHILNRPGKGGQNFDYVTGTYMKKVLNFVFGWMWSFEVLGTEEKYGQVIVRGKLLIHRKDGSVLIWKSDTGKADIKYKKGEKQPMDYGNDEKAAITDCIKRCAAQFGFASDVYGKNEFRDIGETVGDEDKNGTIVYEQGPIGKKEDKYLCAGYDGTSCPGGIYINQQQHDYSMSVYKKDLCPTCQASLKNNRN